MKDKAKHKKSYGIHSSVTHKVFSTRSIQSTAILLIMTPATVLVWKEEDIEEFPTLNGKPEQSIVCFVAPEP